MKITRMKSTPILNREFKHPDDGWYHIEPKGEHPNATAGVVQVIDDEATITIVNGFNMAADVGQLSHGHEMLIDHEHFSHDPDKETRAFGWLGSLQNRVDGIYGQIRWTDTGKKAVDGGDYRFFSTEYDPAHVAIVNRDSKRIRPLALAGLTLTNRPNNRGGKPITNSAGSSSEKNGPQARGYNNNLPPTAAMECASGTSPTGAQVDKQTKTMKSIATKLNLSPDASEEAILGELARIMNRATEAEGKITPLTTENTALKNRVSVLEDEQIDADLDAHGIKDETVRGKIKPGLKLMANRADRVAFLSLTAKPETTTTTHKPLTNRETSKVPGAAREQAGAATDPKKEAKRGSLIANRAREIEKEVKGISLTSAYIQAGREIDGQIESGALTL
jgi:phage I-like protein